MARQTNRLTDAVVRKMAAAGSYNDGDGLYLKITETGTKSWVFRYKRGLKADGKAAAHLLGLGAYPAVSLADARRRADEHRVKLRAGGDPVAERRASAPVALPSFVSFQDAANRYIGAKESGWRNDKHRQQWRNTLDTYAMPVIGKLSVGAITTDHVLRIVEPLWGSKHETATRLRGRIENVLDWAKVRGLRDGENPARWRGHLNHLLPSISKRKTVKHHPAMDWRKVPEFMAELRQRNSISALALQFTILTAVRTSETTGTEWPEIDFANSTWNIPAARMKAGKLHRVPLTTSAVAILKGLPRIDDQNLVFPGARQRRPLSNMAMLELLRGMRPGLTVHGFRSSFRDWAGECTHTPREVAEAALAHEVANEVELAYKRGDFLEKRRKLMELWEAYCLHGADAKVIPMVVNG